MKEEDAALNTTQFSIKCLSVLKHNNETAAVDYGD
jgi:hypothetical protein